MKPKEKQLDGDDNDDNKVAKVASNNNNNNNVGNKNAIQRNGVKNDKNNHSGINGDRLNSLSKDAAKVPQDTVRNGNSRIGKQSHAKENVALIKTNSASNQYIKAGAQASEMLPVAIASKKIGDEEVNFDDEYELDFDFE